MNDITGHNTQWILTLLTVLASIGLFISFTTTVLCFTLSYKRRELARMTIFRVITALQLLEVFDSIFNLIALYVNPTRDANCRVLVFFSLSLSIAPLVLSVLCILYFQIILIHNIPLRRKWPRVMMAVGSVVISIVPPMFTLFVPAKTAGISSYCEYLAAPNARLFTFKWLVFYIWVTLTILFGIFSILTMLVFIAWRSRAAHSQMSIDGFSHSDDNTSVSSLNANVILDVVKDNRSKRRLSNSSVVIQTLRSVIWFPVAPIVCLGFNTAYSIVWYRTKKENNVIFVVDKVLQFLAIPLIAMTFYLSPPVKRAYRQWRLDRKTGNGNRLHRFEEHKMQKRHGAEGRRKRKSQLALRSRSQQSIDLDHDGRVLRHRHRAASLPSSLPPSPVYRSQSPSPETSTLTSRSNSLFYYQDDIN